MKAFIDGSSKGLYGYLIEKGRKRTIKDYPMTNNQAEWLALVALLLDLEPNTKIEIFSDSQIVVNQFLGHWETRNKILKDLKHICYRLVEIKELRVSLKWVSRNYNPYGKILERKVKKERKEKRKLREKMRRYG